jgi:ribonuclease P protein component
VGEKLGFGQAERLHCRREYLDVYGRGNKLHTPHLVVYFLPNGREQHRLGLTVSRKIGKAVIRNRLKRRLRELFRLHKPQSDICWDIVINVKRSAADTSYQTLLNEFKEVLARRVEAKSKL